MSAPFAVGDWVFWPAFERVVQIEKLGSIGQIAYFKGGGLESVRLLVHARVRFPKPKRKLKLSQGLEWLKTDANLALSTDGDAWGVWDIDRRRWVDNDFAVYTSPLKAIIAARKALGVKS